jgi:hypothetical protein
MTSWTESFFSGLMEKGRSMFGVSGLNFWEGATRSKKRHSRTRDPLVEAALTSLGE